MIRRETLEPQIFIPRPDGKQYAPDPATVLVGNAGAGTNNKPGGGLWTSTLATSAKEGWEWWCGIEMPHWLSSFGYVLQPVECRVMTIEPWHVDEFMEIYCVKIHPELSHVTPDWSHVARDADAVRVTDPFHPDLRFGRLLTFYLWDCESTWWNGWHFENTVERIDLTRKQSLFRCVYRVETQERQKTLYLGHQMTIVADTAEEAMERIRQQHPSKTVTFSEVKREAIEVWT